jgi:hypothetical protein
MLLQAIAFLAVQMAHSGATPPLEHLAIHITDNTRTPSADLHHQQIIWDKGRTVLTRTLYWFQHEPCWFVRKKLSVRE